jgi:hypothetical protein
MYWTKARNTIHDSPYLKFRDLLGKIQFITENLSFISARSRYSILVVRNHMD